MTGCKVNIAHAQYKHPFYSIYLLIMLKKNRNSIRQDVATLWPKKVVRQFATERPMSVTCLAKFLVRYKLETGDIAMP